MHPLIKKNAAALGSALSTKTAIRLQLAFFIPVGLLILNAHTPISLVYNYTPSLPTGIYVASKSTAPSYPRGQIVCFKASLPSWTQKRSYGINDNYCKRVSGLPGDTVTLRSSNNSLHVVLQPPPPNPALTLPLLTNDTLKRPIPQQSPWNTHQDPTPFLDINQPKTIPPGYLYLTGDVNNSLDSRYLGPIPGHTVYATLKPLLLF